MRDSTSRRVPSVFALAVLLVGPTFLFADSESLGGGNLSEEAGSIDVNGPPDAKNGDDSLSCDTCGTSDPVELATGEMKFNRTDLTLPGLIEPFSISFTYYSQRMYDGHYGFGWYFPFEMRLFQMASGDVQQVEGDVRWRIGTAEPKTFKRTLAGSFDSPDEYHVNLTREPDGTYTMQERTGVVYNFSVEGLLEQITDRVGNATLIEWESDLSSNKIKFPIAGSSPGEIVARDYRIATITTDLGKNIDFGYYDGTDGAKEGRLKSLTDDYGRVVNYDYDSAGNLLFVTSPVTDYKDDVTEQIVQQGRTIEYQYSPTVVQRDRSPPHKLDHNLLRVFDGRGRLQLENVYDSNDRVSQQNFNDSSSSYFYVEDANGLVSTTTEINTNGFQNVYEFSNSLPVKRTTTASVGHPFSGNIVTQYTYNAAAELTEIVYPLLNGVEYILDAEGNLEEKRRKRVAAANNDDTSNPGSDIVCVYTYESMFNQVKTSSDAEGNVTTYVYDYEPGSGSTGTVGNLVRVEYPPSPPSRTARLSLASPMSLSTTPADK